MQKMALMFCLLPGLAGANLATWTRLTGAEMQAALSGHRLHDANARQAFRSPRRTHYHAGSDGFAYWRVAGNQYRSPRPPADLWACDALEQSGERLRFVGAGGDMTEAVYAD